MFLAIDPISSTHTHQGRKKKALSVRCDVGVGGIEKRAEVAAAFGKVELGAKRIQLILPSCHFTIHHHSSTMDIFRALSGGGARFDKRRFKDDVQLFSPSASTSKTALDGEQPEEASNSGSTIVPRELDFFGSAAKSGTVSERAGGDAKGKGKATDDTAAMGQKRKRQGTLRS